MKNHPTLTAAMAMQLAGFSEEDCSNPSLHRLVRRRLPGRGKKAYQKARPKLSNPPPHAMIEPVADVVFVHARTKLSTPPRTCSTQEDGADIDDEAKTGLSCGNIEGEGDLQGSAQGCNGIVRPREK